MTRTEFFGRELRWTWHCSTMESMPPASGVRHVCAARVVLDDLKRFYHQLRNRFGFSAKTPWGDSIEAARSRSMGRTPARSGRRNLRGHTSVRLQELARWQSQRARIPPRAGPAGSEYMA